MEAGIQARESVANERRRRLDAEEDAKLRSEVMNKKSFFPQYFN